MPSTKMVGEARGEAGATSAIERLLIDVFGRLTDKHVSYCVLRNYDEMPQRIGNDVDLLVSPSDVERFEQCLSEACGATQWTLLKRPKRFGYRSYWMRDRGAGGYVHLDAWSLLTWKGLRWADERAILGCRKALRGFHVPDRGGETSILFFKDLIQNGEVKPVYHPDIVAAASDATSSFSFHLSLAVGRRLASTLCDKVVAGEWEGISALKGAIRRAVFLRNLLRRPVGTVVSLCGFLLGHLGAMFSSRAGGMFVAYIGPDGSGKSAVSQGLAGSLAELFPRMHYFHGRFGFIPDLRFFANMVRRLFGQRLLPPAARGPDAPQDVPPHSRLRALCYLVYYSMDYMIGHWRIRRIQGNGDLIICDRYFFDYFVMDVMQRLPWWLFKPLSWVLPRPDLVLFLAAPPEVIRQRKQELTLEQIARQNSRCERLIALTRVGVTIDADRSVDAVVHDISERILETLACRQN